MQIDFTSNKDGDYIITKDQLDEMCKLIRYGYIKMRFIDWIDSTEKPRTRIRCLKCEDMNR